VPARASPALVVVGDVPVVADNRSERPDIILVVAGNVEFNGRSEWLTPSLHCLAKQGRVCAPCSTTVVVCRCASLRGSSTIHCEVRRSDEDLPSAAVTIAEAHKPPGHSPMLRGERRRGEPRAGRVNHVGAIDEVFDQFWGTTDAGEAWEKSRKKLELLVGSTTPSNH
jgi:hypothetical protein